MSKWPDLNYYNVAVARYGGPVAFMIQDNVLFIGQKEIKSLIFIFTSYGRLINVINMPEKLNTPADRLKWVCFDFTSEEDLFLLSAEGVIYQLEPMSGDFIDKKPPTLGLEFS
mmetsp:Transcript_27223/g.26268  ORF Transcript_27223/g.26268 Transcript_27223/m.26268 type:complete len:113 (-) Transcript_27223:2391-2729(-)